MSRLDYVQSYATARMHVLYITTENQSYADIANQKIECAKLTNDKQAG